MVPLPASNGDLVEAKIDQVFLGHFLSPPAGVRIGREGSDMDYGI